MFAPSQMSYMTIRTADREDRRRLERLAALDSARPLDGDALVAEVDGDTVAALDLGSGRAIADPFRPTAGALNLLRTRAAQLR